MKSPAKSLSMLGAVHALFFIATAIFILFVKEEGDVLLSLGFFLTGIFAFLVWFFLNRNFPFAAGSAILSAAVYWGFAFYYGRYWGFINGISITISLMALLGLILLFRRPQKHSGEN